VRADGFQVGAPAYLHHPLRGPVAIDCAARSDGTIDIPALPASPDFPQLAITSGENRAVWPLWQVALVQDDATSAVTHLCQAASTRGFDLKAGDGLCWISTGMDQRVLMRGSTRVHLTTPPMEPALFALFERALGVLIRWRGALPWRELNILLESQNPDSHRERGYAHAASDGSIWCRALIRPGRTPAAAFADPAAAAELIVHELLHLLLEFDTPAGHLLTEGLITYLARRLLVLAHVAPPVWMSATSDLAASEIRQSRYRRHSLDWATTRFFDNLDARRLAYRKGHLTMRALDDLLGGQLPRVARDLSLLQARRGRPLAEKDILSRITPKGRDLYRRALSAVGENAPGAKGVSKMRLRDR
jgi:hypothetical protein